MLILAFVLAASGSIPPIVPILMAVVGIVLFIFGFVKYREYRLLADTPQIPVRSVSMGLSHVAGNTVGGQTLVSPLTQVPCYYYEVRVEQQVKRDNQETWEETHRDRAEVPFYVQDDTGKILVNPVNAEYNLPQAFWGELRPPMMIQLGRSPRKVDPSLNVPAPTDDHLRAYLSGQFTQARTMLQGSNMPGAKIMDKGLAVAQGVQMLGMSVGSGGITMDFGNHPYRFTEICLPAGRPTHVLGSCTENPNPADDGDRNMIRRGQNDKTFLISTKSEEKLEGSLRLQSIFMVVIGALLILGAAAVQLHSSHKL